MDKENSYSGVIDEEAAAITERQAECLELYLECGSTRAVAELLQITQKRVAYHLNAVAKSRGLNDLRQLLSDANNTRHAADSKIVKPRVKRRDDLRPTTKRLMQLIQQQEYRCALSGVKLTPSDAALDHKLPVSSGGSDEIENLHWVSNQVNRAKGTMTNDEFIEMCKQVAKWNS